MYSVKIFLEGLDNINQYEELIKVFLQPSEYEITDSADDADFSFSFDGDKNKLKREIFDALSAVTGEYLPA